MGPQKGIDCAREFDRDFYRAASGARFQSAHRWADCVAAIGSPRRIDCFVAALECDYIHAISLRLIAPRPADSNKGIYGHVLVVGGSLGKAGSVAMAGMSALRAGAGLATVATAKSALPTVAGFHPELMTEPLPETAAGTIADRSADSHRMNCVKRDDRAGDRPGNLA